MADAPYSPNNTYPSDEQYNITGSVINGISKQILSLQAEVQAFKDAKLEDELADFRLRDKNPAVKDAWDQYQTVLGLATRN